MKTKLIDISVGMEAGMPSWPGSAGFEIYRTSDLSEGISSNNSRISCDVHIGTHIDAPWHFIENGATIEMLDLGKMIGDAFVVDVRGEKVIDHALLSRLSIPQNMKRVLFRTDNSALWSSGETMFNRDYVALSADGAKWVVDNGIDLVGIDYLSIQRFNDPPVTHETLLQHKTVILEGICLEGVEEGVYELICLPIKLVGADGAPARAILRTL